jgi:phosphatidylinositol 4-kinase
MKPIMDYMDDETPCGQSTYRQKLDATGDPISFGSNHSLSSSCSSLSLSRQSSQHSTHFSDPTQILAPMSFTMATDDSQGVKVFSLSQYLVNNMKWPHHKPLHGIHGGGSVGGPCIEDDTSSALDITTRMMGSSSVPINDGHPPSPAPFFSNVSSGNDYLTHKHPGIRHSLSLPYISHTRHQPDDTPPPHLPELESSSSTSSFLSPRASSDGSSGIPEAALLTNRGNQGLGKQHWSHYGHFQNEMQFLAALSDIAERLVAVPRHARTSTLQAELALINHRLPTEICLPLWCSGDGSSLHHHHVVRVSPYDAVVLNSAERVREKRKGEQTLTVVILSSFGI